ncbi:MAG: alcohol dehydrogenase catalytic domain-containing protein [Thermoplasmata archaeon]
MRALVVKPGNRGVQLKEVSLQVENKIKIKTLYNGICGTDREIVGNTLPFVRPEKGNELILGHEALGRVVEVPENSKYKVGDIVAPMVRRPGNCMLCRMGRQDYCIDGDFVEAGIRGKDGFMREYFYEDEKYLIKVDSEIGEIGALVEPTKNVMKMVEVFSHFKNRIAWDCDDSTLNCKGAWVFGTGSEGVLSSLVFKSIGFNVTIVNRHPIPENVLNIIEKNRINFFDSSTNEWSKALKENTMDIAIDAAGSADVFSEAIEYINYNGIIIMFGTAGTGKLENGSFITRIVDKNLSIAGVEDGSKNHYIQAAKFLSEYNIKYSMHDIITGKFKPEDTWIFDEKPKNEIKSIIEW